MAIIHTPTTQKRKPKKLNAKQRELQAEWEKLMKKYEPKKPLKAKKPEMLIYTLNKPRDDGNDDIPSLDTGPAPALKVEQPKYTGTKMLGVSAMHKSNLVPVFNNDAAVEISRMRRG